MGISKNSLVGTKVFFYHFHYNDGKGEIKIEPFYVKKDYVIALNSETKVVIEDESFTTLDIDSKNGAGFVLEKPFVFTAFGDKNWGDYLNFTLYSLSEISNIEIHKILEEEITKKYNVTPKFDFSKIL